MRTRFEFVLRGTDAGLLRAAGEEALHEVVEAERELSRFRREALTAGVNREAAERAIEVPARFAAVLQTCFEVHAASRGAFDPVMRADGSRPDPRGSGLPAVALDAAACTVRFLDPDVQLDFGAIGKGVALDRAAEVLADSGVASALLHGGTSTVLALGPDPWALGVPDPDAPDRLLWRGRLCGEALSVSSHAHVADAGPTRTAVARVAAAASRRGDEAARADAWSTALVVTGTLPLEVRRCA